MACAPPGAASMSPTDARIRQVMPARVDKNVSFFHMSSMMVSGMRQSSTVLAKGLPSSRIFWASFRFLGMPVGSGFSIAKIYGRLLSKLYTRE